jgi:hypothetical protein
MRRHLRTRWLPAFALAGFTLALPCAAQSTLYVDASCGSDQWSGASATCSAPNGPKATIGAALTAASPGDLVIVSPGRYVENLRFNGKNVRLHALNASAGLADPLDPSVASIIDGSQPTDQTARCAVCFSGTEDATCELEGFTITGGTGWMTSSGFRQGGGIYGGDLGQTFVWTRAAIRECSVTGNSARFGAGISKCGGEISDCRVFANATADAGGGNHGGGGLQACNGTISRCQIVDNRAFEGAGCYACGGTIRECTIARNEALWSGGALIYCDFATLSNCLLANNRASTANNGLGAGGAVFSSQTTYINCTIAFNSAVLGGGIYGYQQFTPTLRNCIVWGNSATTGPQIAINATTTPAVLRISYSDLQGGLPGVYLANGMCSIEPTAVAASDPSFADVPQRDYRVLAGSPCIDSASNLSLLPAMLVDLNGNPRRWDDPQTPDTGLGSAPIVDMGAYEFQRPGCSADFNADGQLDFFDYLDFAQAFASDDPSADFNTDGQIDFFDYLDFAAAFDLGCD